MKILDVINRMCFFELDSRAVKEIYMTLLNSTCAKFFLVDCSSGVEKVLVPDLYTLSILFDVLLLVFVLFADGSSVFTPLSSSCQVRFTSARVSSESPSACLLVS